MTDLADDTSSLPATESEGRPPPPENILGYDVVKAAPAYSGAAGLVSGFALAAVVLVLTVAASNKIDHAQEIYLGFATSLFALGFIGCLFCSFSFASLGGENTSPAAMTYSMLIGSGVLISLIAVLGGFEALSQAFLHGSEPLFIMVTALTAVVAPLLVWAPTWDIVQRFGPSAFDGPPRSTGEALTLLIRVWILGILGACAGVTAHYAGIFGRPRQWEYYVVTSVGLCYVGAMVAVALYVSVRTADERARASSRQTWLLAGLQSATIFLMVSLLP